MVPDMPPPAPDLLCTSLLQRFQFAVLEHTIGAKFRLIGHPPAWLFRLYPEAEASLEIAIDARTPVLHNFLIDATALWQAHDQKIERS